MLEKTVASSYAQVPGAFQEVAKASRVTNVAPERKAKGQGHMGQVNGQEAQSWFGAKGCWELREGKEQGVWQPHTITRSNYLNLHRIPPVCL